MEDVQELEVIKIEDHPIHGSFEAEVPLDMAEEDVKKYVDGLDLDLLLGFQQGEDQGVTDVEKLKGWENSVGAGKRKDKWYSHKSLEGGSDTLAYGHKLTPEEVESGIIEVDDKSFNWKEGLTEDQALAVLNKDANYAKNIALASLKKANLDEDLSKVQALTSLIYNVGSGSWGRSKAKKYLEAGQVEDFMHEAFSPEIGFVKINGDVSRGLVRRRADEASLFAQGNIEKGDSIMSQILEAINPISSAQASDIVPQELMKGNTYSVVSGDTLGKIAKNNNTTVDEIMTANPDIKDANKIGLGQSIILPSIRTENSQSQESSFLSTLNPISSAQASVPTSQEQVKEESIFKAATKFNVVPTALTSFAESLFKGASNKFFNTSFENVENNNLTVSEGDVDALTNMVKYIKSKGRTSFNKDDWKDLIGTDLADTGGSGVSSMDKILKVMKDPIANMAMTIGAGTIKEDKEGKIYIEDVYDFNEGKQGAKYKKVEDKKGFFNMVSTLFNDPKLDTYTKFRILGYVLQPEVKDKKTKIYLSGNAVERLKLTVKNKQDVE